VISNYLLLFLFIAKLKIERWKMKPFIVAWQKEQKYKIENADENIL
jgi:hypothetical protein